MKRNTLSILGCPDCHANLIFAGQDSGNITHGIPTCLNCQRIYPVVDGIPHFIEAQALSRFNRRFSQMYDFYARGYEKFIPGFKKSFGGKRKEIVVPIDLVPVSMLEQRVFDGWKGWLYCIEFGKV